MANIKLSELYRNFYVSDCRKPVKAGYTRLWLNDGITHPSYTGNYDVPDHLVSHCLNHYEQDGPSTVEFKDLNN